MPRSSNVPQRVIEELKSLSSDGKVRPFRGGMLAECDVWGIPVQLLYEDKPEPEPGYHFRLKGRRTEPFLPLGTATVDDYFSDLLNNAVMQEEWSRWVEELERQRNAVRVSRALKKILERLEEMDETERNQEMQEGLLAGLKDVEKLRKKELASSLLMKARPLKPAEQPLLLRFLAKEFGKAAPGVPDRKAVLSAARQFRTKLARLVKLMRTDSDSVAEWINVTLIDEDYSIAEEDFSIGARDFIVDCLGSLVTAFCTFTGLDPEITVQEIGKMMAVLLYLRAEFWLMETLTDGAYGEMDRLVEKMNGAFGALSLG